MEIREIRYFDPNDPDNQAIERIDNLTEDEIKLHREIQARWYHRTEFEYLPTKLEP
jgi:hypothetical protein